MHHIYSPPNVVVAQVKVQLNLLDPLLFQDAFVLSNKSKDPRVKGCQTQLMVVLGARNGKPGLGAPEEVDDADVVVLQDVGEDETAGAGVEGPVVVGGEVRGDSSETENICQIES